MPLDWAPIVAALVSAASVGIVTAGGVLVVLRIAVAELRKDIANETRRADDLTRRVDRLEDRIMNVETTYAKHEENSRYFNDLKSAINQLREDFNLSRQQALDADRELRAAMQNQLSEIWALWTEYCGGRRLPGWPSPPYAMPQHGQPPHPSDKPPGSTPNGQA